jgi:hypothetical protein
MERRCTGGLRMCSGNETDLWCDWGRHRRVPWATGFDGSRRLRRDGELDKRQRRGCFDDRCRGRQMNRELWRSLFSTTNKDIC